MAAKRLSVSLTLNDKQFQSGLRKATKSLTKFGASMKRTGQSLSQNLTLPLAALGVTSIKLASDFAETQAKFNTVFRDIQGKANETAKTLERDFGLSSKASKELLGNTGDLLTGFGFTQEEALKLSSDVNKLAVDLASFTNVEGGAATASQALTKALLGERESVKQLGIAITEADLKAFAEEQGLVFKELDRVAKATLTFELAARQSANAIGDYERTSGSFANQTRRLMADLENLGVEIGQVLLPIAQKGIEFFKKLVNAFRNLTPEAKENTVVFGLLAGAVGPLLVVLGSIVTVVTTLGIKFIAIGAAIAALALGILYVVDNWEAFKERFSDIGWWRNALIDMIQFLITNSPIAVFIKGINAALEYLGKNPIPNPFEDMAEGLEDLKVETKEYENDFQDFGTFIGNQGEKIKKSLSGIGDAFGVGAPSGGGGGGGGGESKPQKFNKDDLDFSLDFGEEEEAVDEFDTAEIVANLQKLEEQMKNIDSLSQNMEGSFVSFGGALQQAFSSALVSQGDFFKVFVENAKRALKQIAAQIAAMAILNALLGGTGIGGMMGFKDIGGFGGIPKLFGFADGGMVTGATIAMVGEGPGTSAINPEVIAPLDKLQGMIGNAGGKVEVVGKISGSDILLASDRAQGNRKRTRGY